MPGDRIPGYGRHSHLRPRPHTLRSGPFASPEADLSRPVTAKMAVQCLELLNLETVATATIRSWAERGKVRKLGRDQYGAMRYELHDIIRCVSGETTNAA